MPTPEELAVLRRYAALLAAENEINRNLVAGALSSVAEAIVGGHEEIVYNRMVVALNLIQ